MEAYTLGLGKVFQRSEWVASGVSAVALSAYRIGALCTGPPRGRWARPQRWAGSTISDLWFSQQTMAPLMPLS